MMNASNSLGMETIPLMTISQIEEMRQSKDATAGPAMATTMTATMTTANPSLEVEMGGANKFRQQGKSSMQQQQQQQQHHSMPPSASGTGSLSVTSTPTKGSSSLVGSLSAASSPSPLPTGHAAQAGGMPPGLKLLIGAGGIYAVFLYYGSLQEDVFRYVSAEGETFQQAWFLQALEAFANVIVAFVGMHVNGPTKGIPLRMFYISGASQVTAKACTSLALANGLSFPIATLAKSGKMAPVMFGSALLGGAQYDIRDYLQVAAIIGGTAIVSMGKKKSSEVSDSMMGLCYITLSLVLDGITAGFQKRLKRDTADAGVKVKSYDFMFWTNVSMCFVAASVAIVLGEWSPATSYLMNNPEIMSSIIKFIACSAIGQSFIFFTIAHFDPLVLTTVTTTRKIFSVLLSIFMKGHTLSSMGWSGMALACGGIMSELQDKSRKMNHAHRH